MRVYRPDIWMRMSVLATGTISYSTRDIHMYGCTEILYFVRTYSKQYVAVPPQRSVPKSLVVRTYIYICLGCRDLTGLHVYRLRTYTYFFCFIYVRVVCGFITRPSISRTVPQGMSMRSRANFGNTHMMASQPGPVSLSFKKLVGSGLSFVEARKHVARATR